MGVSWCVLGEDVVVFFFWFTSFVVQPTSIVKNLSVDFQLLALFVGSGVFVLARWSWDGPWYSLPRQPQLPKQPKESNSHNQRSTRAATEATAAAEATWGMGTTAAIVTAAPQPS